MQNIKEKSFKIIIVLLTSVMLLNIAMPTLVYAAPDQTQTQEEKEEDFEKVNSIIGKNNNEGFEDNGKFWETNIVEKIEGSIGGLVCSQVFRAICYIATTISDGVLNLIQGLILPCSPTAVARRDDSDYIKQKLDARNDNSYIIGFATIPAAGMKGGAGDHVEYQDTSAIEVPFIYYSPLTILSNKVPLFDINFIGAGTKIINPFLADENGNYSDQAKDRAKERLQNTEKTTKTYMAGMAGKTEKTDQNAIDAINNEVEEAANDAQGENKGNPAVTLQKVISKWYITLRNLSIVGLLIVLIYIGIRILISAAADEKAKYKSMLKDWFMALVLVVMLHIIMLALITIVSIVTRVISSIGIDFYNDPTGGEVFMNTIRTKMAQNARTLNWFTQLGYTILYVTAIWYIIIFTWKFLKRVIYMAFLTMIAPLVGLTYPIDKIGDGKSQAFNLWFKEYTFNLLIQPIDLILYTVLVESAIKMVETNFIYGVIAIGFILQGENFIKKMFRTRSRRRSRKK